MELCIAKVFKHNQQDATLHNGIYYFKYFLPLAHASGKKKQKKLDKYPMLCIQF